MKRPLCWPLIFSSLLALAIPCQGQTQPAPFYTLPNDGTWVEYEWVQTLSSGKQVGGTLRISSVGRTEIDRSQHRCVEIKRSTGQGDAVRTRYRKLLVEEKALGKGQAFNNAVRRCFDKNDIEGGVTELSSKRLVDFLGMGLRGDAVLKERAASEDVPTKLGKLASRHVSTDGESGPVYREYHGWLTDKVPFGWAKLEIHEKAEKEASKVVFRALAARTGQNARSEVDELGARSRH